ncbi:MAG: hypothetical protein ACTHLE_05755 [Agriterribacter sp.]
MLKPPHFQCPPEILEKLERLALTLQEEHTHLKSIASEISHRQLRNSIHLAAQECNQFAAEVSAQISMLDQTRTINSTESTTVDIIALPVNISSEAAIKKAVRRCRTTELRLAAAYREMLNEPYLLPDLRVLLRRQYNGVLCAFLQLKLLDGNYIYCSDDFEE